MKTADKFALGILVLAIGLIAYGAIGLLYKAPFGEADTLNVYAELPTAKAWIGPNSSTEVAATNTARTYLEIQNAGATSSVTVYCSTNGRSGALFEGIVISPTSSRIWKLDDLYRGAINCRSQNASTTLFIQEH